MEIFKMSITFKKIRNNKKKIISIFAKRNYYVNIM